MSKLYFKVEADYEKVIRLREECKKLEEQLKNMDSTSSPASVRKLETQLSEARSEMSGLTSEAARAGAQMEHGFKSKIYEASKAVNELSMRIISQRTVVKKAGDEAKRLGEAYRDALKTRPSEADGLLERYKAAKMSLQGEKDALFGLTQEQAKARLSVKKLRDEYKLYEKSSDGIRTKNKDVKDSFEGMSLSLGKAVGIIGGTAALKELASQIVRVRGEFQEMETSIETMVGKNVAGKLIPQIKELAKISPLTMSDMVGAEKMMLGFNIAAEDTVKYLKAMSDLSMGSSTKFNSLTLAFSQMSAAGKLMGQDLNQMINAGFNPLQEISKQTGKSIAQLKDEMSKGAVSAQMVQQAFISATSEGGKFFKMSENASKTINGQISMMEDATDAMFNEIGKASEGFIVKSISGVTSLIENYETVGKVLVGLIATYGTYKAALLAVMAMEKAHAVVRLASIKGISAMSAATGLLAKKMGILNAVMRMNPYAAVAAALAALATAVWAVSDGTSAASRALKEYNKEKEDSIAREKEHKEKVEELLETSRNESLATLERQKSLEELKKEYPKIFEKYDLEKLKLEDILNLKRQINEEDSKKGTARRKKDFEELKQTLSNQRRYVALYENPKLRKNLSDEDRQIWKMFAGKQSIVQVREQMRKNSEKLKMYQKDVLADNLHSYTAELKKYSDAKLKRELESAKSEAAKRNGFPINGMMVKGQNLDDVIKSLEGEQNRRKTAPTYQKAYDDAKKDWEEKKRLFKEVEDDKKKFTVEVYEARKKAKEAAEAKFKALGGIISESAGKDTQKGIKEQGEALEQQRRILEMESRFAQEFASQQVGVENQAAQARIDAMDDGYEKITAQRELNNRIELENIEAQKNAYIEKYVQTQKQIFDARENLKAKEDSTYRKKAFDASSVKVDTSAFDAMSADVQKRQNNEKIKAQEAAWNEYLRKFGTYQQKRKAIMESYDKQIREASTAGDAAVLEREKLNALDELDERMKGSATLMGELFEDSSQKSVSEIQKIIDKAEMLLSYLAAAKDEQGNAVIGGKSVSEKDILNLGISKNTLQNLEIAPDKIKAIQDAVRGLKGEMEKESPFKAFEVGIKKSMEAFKKAGGMKGKAKTNEIGKGISGIGESVVAFTPALKEFGNNLGNIFGNDKIGKTIGGISDAIGGLGETASGVGQILSGDIVGGAMAAVGGISSVVSAFEGLFGADYSEYEDMKARYEALTSLWDDLIDKKSEYISIDYGIEAQKAADEAEKLIRANIQRQRTLMKKLSESGSSTTSHSLGHRIDARMEASDWERISEKVGQQIKSQTDLWNLSAEQIERILTDEKLMDVLTTVNSDFVTYLQNIVKYGEQLDDVAEKERTAVSGLSFEEFRDGYVNMISDLESTNEDFAETFEKQMQNAIFRALIADQYADKIKELYESWVSLGKDGLSQTEAEFLRGQQSALTEEMLAKRKEIMDAFGWKAGQEEARQSEITGLGELQKAYGRLSEAVSKVYSSERVRAVQQQNDNLVQQKRLIEERIAIEKNEDSLKSYRDQLEDINAQLEANKEAARDAIFGSDVQSAINDFVSAYTGALGKGDTSGVAEKYVENMVKQMVVEAMKMDASPVVNAIRTKLIEAWKDGVVSADEQAAVKDLINQLNKEFEDKYGWADGMFREDEVPERQSSEIDGVKELQNAYNDLSREMDKAYSTDRVKLIQEQINLLEKQKRLIEQSIAKGGDADLIEGWNEQLKDVNQSIEDAKEAQIDAIFGTDIQNAVSSFANALIDAWARGEDRAKTSQQIVKSIIRSLVVEMMKMSLAPMIEKMRDEIQEMLKDGIISSEEHSVINGMVDSMSGLMENQFAWADEFLKDEQTMMDNVQTHVEEIETDVEEIADTFSNITFEGMRDDFVSQLSDMNTSYEDMCNNFEDKLRQSIIRGFLESKYQSQIQNLISTWDMYGESGGNINEAELEKLRKQYQQLLQAMIDDRDDLADKMGWSDLKDQYRQEASSKGFNAMDQETGDELNGRFTAMYESDLRREAILAEQLSLMKGGTPITEVKGNVIPEDFSGLENIADDTRTILANSYVELQQIRENTGAIIKPIRQMQKDIAEVKRNTERL